MGRQSSDFEGGLALYSGAVADNTERIDGVDGCSSTDGDSLEHRICHRHFLLE